MTLKISKETKSKAYQFMKALLKDGADGTQINELVSDMGEKLGKDISGQILMDLLTNPEDVYADEKPGTYWFGPINYRYFSWIIGDWHKYCKNNYINGSFNFGDLELWKEWRKTGKDKSDIDDDELNKLSNDSREQLCIFTWTADNLQTLEIRQFLDEMFNSILLAQKEEEKK